ncbi:STYKc [Musa troglodytarum]|uniref:STYKc n=1 Tax=Musa troglodytarum TaxID=320322 RepID=A0A9E7KUN0_9LILI|nr:STYKc [Musa troglodytarum]
MASSGSPTVTRTRLLSRFAANKVEVSIPHHNRTPQSALVSLSLSFSRSVSHAGHPCSGPIPCIGFLGSCRRSTAIAGSRINDVWLLSLGFVSVVHNDAAFHSSLPPELFGFVCFLFCDCPLDFSWLNISLASSACANQNERGKCCRYINAIVAISIARFANATGRLGVPPAVTEGCLSSIPETLSLYGITANASAFCGLGPKIRVSYQCQGRATVLEMMQSPNFSDVIETCNVPLSLDNSCKRCLNSGIIFLHHLIATDDNITLSVCRDAVFVTLANQGGNFSAVDMAASLVFKGLVFFQV